MSQYYNADEILLIPVVSVEEKKPVVKKFAAVEDLQYRRRSLWRRCLTSIQN